jgi:hypothetical protein
MRRPPFLMKTSRHAVLRCDGRFIVGGRASFVWETFLERRVAGVPGAHEIRRDGNENPWHRLDWTIEEATEALLHWGSFGPRRVKRLEKSRASRAARGLEVA